MSLLMDALKRAEETKQEAKSANHSQGKSATDSAPGNLSLQPIDESHISHNNSPLPDLAAHLEAVDADLAEVANPTPHRLPPPKPSTPEKDRDVIRNIFAVKQGQAASRKHRASIGIGIVFLLSAVIGGYFWFQLKSINSASLAKPVDYSPPISLPEQKAAPVAERQTNAGITIDAPSLTFSKESSLFTPLRDTRRPPQSSTDNVEQPANQVRLTRTSPETDPGLTLGQAHLLHNEIELAKESFEQTLRRDPNNTDALLALAAIAHRQRRPSEAERLYQQAWVANPADAAVQAALLSGASADNDVLNAESRLKILIDKQPDSAALNFALGNVLARQNRWIEAQQAYFNAVAAEEDNPDYLFNLAISLDHIRQPTAAAQHYRLALEMSARRPAAFNAEQARKRLAALSPEPK